MKHHRILAFVLSAPLFASCALNLNTEDKNAELEDVSVGNEYSLGVPTYMMKTTALNDEASLQFQNIFKEAYIIVIDEDKEEFIEAYKELNVYDTTRSVISNYTDMQMQLTTSNLEVIDKKGITTLKINGLNAASTEIDANVDGVPTPITYFLTFVEGKEKLYMIMAWTLQKNKDTYRETFQRVGESFRTLNESPVAGN